MTPVTLALKVGSFVALGLAAGQAMHRIASAPSRKQVTTGLRGWKRRRALRESQAWASIEPFVRWLGVRLRNVVPPGIADSIDRTLMLAGDVAGLTAEEVVAVTALTIPAGAVLGLFFGQLTGLGPRFAIAGAVLGMMAPWNRLVDASRTRLQTISRRIPYLVDLLGLSVGAGMDFPGALRRIVEKASDPNDPLIEELTLILRSLQLGRTRRSALEDFAERAPVSAVREFVGTIIQAEEQGNSISDALAVLAQMTRLKRSIDAEEKAARAGLLMLGPLGLMAMAIFGTALAPVLISLKDILK